MDVPRFLTGRITRTILIVYQVTISFLFFFIHFFFYHLPTFHVFAGSPHLHLVPDQLLRGLRPLYQLVQPWPLHLHVSFVFLTFNKDQEHRREMILQAIEPVQLLRGGG